MKKLSIAFRMQEIFVMMLSGLAKTEQEQTEILCVVQLKLQLKMVLQQ